jgi:hypothetical protein
LSAVTVPAYAGSGPHDSSPRGHHHRHGDATAVLVIDRVATPVFQVAPGVDPEPTFPAVTVSARLRGCVPGELYVLHGQFFQRHREITGLNGGLGVGEFTCGADGTARVALTPYDPAGRLHPGKLRVRLEVVTFRDGEVLARDCARVRIPR